MPYTLEDSRDMHAHWASLEKYGLEQPVNIFYLDHDPIAAAQAHCDRHVVKMILETAQLLSTAWHVLSPELVESGWQSPETDVPVPGETPWLFNTLAGHRVYRKTHENHPCAVWARESEANYRWLWRLGMALLDEYEFRYGREHASGPVLWALEAAPPSADRRTAQTEPPTAMPEELFVVRDGYIDAVASYRNYYVTAKQGLLRWTRRPAPSWVCHDGTAFVLSD